MNKVILMGRLVKEPKVRYTQGGEPMAVARYTLAVNRKLTKNGQQEADFINCVAFGKLGEFANKYLRKGQLIRIVGRLQVRSWDDQNGQKRWSTEVVIENIALLKANESLQNDDAIFKILKLIMDYKKQRNMKDDGNKQL